MRPQPAPPEPSRGPGGGRRDCDGRPPARPTPASPPAGGGRTRGSALPAGRLQREIVRQARSATGARAVSVGRIDRRWGRIACGAFAAEPSARYRRTLEALAEVAPGYRPDRYVLPVALNPDCLAAFTGGSIVLWPFGRIAAGQRQSQVLDVFRDEMGLRWTLHVPVLLRGRVVAGLDFNFARRPDGRQTATALAFARIEAARFEHALLTGALRTRIEALRRARRRATAAEERVRTEVAELLHGHVQTRLLMAVRRIEECRRALGDDLPEAGALLGDLAANLEALRENEVRQASHLLHPTGIRSGLVPALTVMTERFGVGLRVRLEIAPEAARLDHPLTGALEDEVRLALYRVAEEAMVNVVRHAGAAQVTILLALTGEAGRRSLLLQVRDDGRGFDAARTRWGLGVDLARDRLAQLDGSLQVRSAPGRGTLVQATVPLSR